jgi:hypothetical protein
MPRLRDRPTGELLVLMISTTVCFSIICIVLAVLLMETIRPATDTTDLTAAVGRVITTTVALAAGFLGGRTDLSVTGKHRGEANPDEPA